ncbi:MAG: hypothetical protein BroJett011_67660 [Chloroflexota bacterium]|nr:MAG: hypothetical protein BroJett011_67660 [Chloroflexota bacterium]
MSLIRLVMCGQPTLDRLAPYLIGVTRWMEKPSLNPSLWEGFRLILPLWGELEGGKSFNYVTSDI